jgi:hypothetical protein
MDSSPVKLSNLVLEYILILVDGIRILWLDLGSLHITGTPAGAAYFPKHIPKPT